MYPTGGMRFPSIWQRLQPSNDPNHPSYDLQWNPLSHYSYLHSQILNKDFLQKHLLSAFTLHFVKFHFICFGIKHSIWFVLSSTILLTTVQSFNNVIKFRHPFFCGPTFVIYIVLRSGDQDIKSSTQISSLNCLPNRQLTAKSYESLILSLHNYSSVGLQSYFRPTTLQVAQRNVN
jgi:hypothetical protein